MQQIAPSRAMVHIYRPFLGVSWRPRQYDEPEITSDDVTSRYRTDHPPRSTN